MRRQPLSHDRKNRHLLFDGHIGDVEQIRNDIGAATVIVDRDGDAHFGGRDDVHGGGVFLECLEHAAQKAMRHQHSRRCDVDDGDASLARERRERTIASRGLLGDQGSGAIGPMAVQNADGDVARYRGEDCARMQHFRSEIREFRRLGEREMAHDFGVCDDARIGREHAVDIGPDLNLGCAECGADQRR